MDDLKFVAFTVALFAATAALVHFLSSLSKPGKPQ